jgi:hypothetical protein
MSFSCRTLILSGSRTAAIRFGGNESTRFHVDHDLAARADGNDAQSQR